MDLTREEKDWIVAVLKTLTFKVDALAQMSLANSILNKLTQDLPTTSEVVELGPGESPSEA